MKAVKKIASILPWALAIIAVIAAVTIFVYADRAEIDNVTEAKVAELQESNAGLQSTVDNLQNTVKGLQSTVDRLRDELESKYAYDDLRWEMEDKAEEMERLIDAMPADKPNAIDVIARDLFEAGSGEIRQLRYYGTEFLPFTTPYIEAEVGDSTYCKCDMLYSDAVKIYSQIFTGDALEDYMSHMFADIDGYLYAFHGGGGSGTGFDNVALTRVSETENEIKYKVSYTHNFYVETIETCSMTIKLVNGSWRISEIDYLAEYW